ncbi:branched-chain amino acid ABC transporter permease [soil metagenome]
MVVGQQIINGLLLGGVLTLVALGFSLVWGIMNIINLAHGSFVMLGAYMTFWMFNLFGIDPFLSIPISMAILFVIGYGLQIGLINWVVRAPVLITLLLTFGLDLVIINISLLLWSANTRSVNPSYFGKSIEIGSMVIPYVQLAVLVLALIITALLALLLSRTRTGQSIRAVGYDYTGAKVIGISIARTYALTFGIGAALAGAAGALLVIIRPVTPSIGPEYTVLAFAVCVLGGLGNVSGALVGGLIFGMVEVFVSAYIGAGYSEAFVFALLIVVLVIRPQGILGREYSSGVEE